jgi:iron complex transport system permease protein
MKTLAPAQLLTKCAWLCLILLASAVVGVLVGHSELDLLKALSDPSSVERSILLEHRLPRVILAALVGAGLASSGAAFQALMRNPLADPFILGASGGAALGGTLAMSMGLGAMTVAGVLLPVVPVATFLGSLVALVLVYSLASRSGRLNTVDVLLIGVVFNFFASAVVMVLKTMVTAEKAQELLFWLMGTLDVERVDDLQLWTGFALVVVGFLYLMRHAHALNVLTLGEEAAGHLGIPIERVRRGVFIATSIMVGAAVSVSGLIGFVGLIVPHGVRLTMGADHRMLLPASALSGAAFLILCDALSRVLFPVFTGETPVGVITAFIGGPVFVYLMRKSSQSDRLQLNP